MLIADRNLVCPLDVCGPLKNIITASIVRRRANDRSWVRNVTGFNIGWVTARFRKPVERSPIAIQGQFVGCAARASRAVLAILPVSDADVKRTQDGN